MSKKKNRNHPLFGRNLHIPRMSTGGAEVMAAAFRSLGVNACVSPESNDKTLTLASRFTSGEECLPQRVVLGNFLKIILDKEFNPLQHAFLLPTSSGPCRFGQYAPFLKKLLREMGYEEALVFSPTSSDGYEGFDEYAVQFKRTAWRAIVVSDLLRKCLLMFRPYEKNPGDAGQIHHKAIKKVSEILSDNSLSLKSQLKKLQDELDNIIALFLKIPLKEEISTRPLIGVVGEIYLRFNSFSNQDMLRRIEALGGESWIADISEWVWYTNEEEIRKLCEAGKRISPSMLGARIRHKIQEWDEKELHKPFESLFMHRQEARVKTLLQYSHPYLPQNMALGEMTLNAGKTIDFYKSGCDGIVDISPFTCMNGIVSEVIYPQISRDHNDIPIRIFYFDGVPFDLDGDLEIFIEQVQAYREKRRMLGNE
jgi:predicted nucleotide-binding protein (sugar kinase/HSP70/actin superfamily)